MKTAVDLGSRWELFVDDWLIEEMRGLRLQLHHPERREVVFTGDAPWEDTVAFPLSLVAVEEGWWLYYRAGILDWSREDDTYVTALAESADGLTFTRPHLGLVRFQGSAENNLLQIGGFPSVPPAFRDTNPACPPGQRYKGLAARWEQAFPMGSPDGLRWSPLQPNPLDLPGQFDTVNTAFWDLLAGCYRCYTRCWYDPERGRPIHGQEFEEAAGRAVRAIQHATSPDFLHWSRPEPLVYADGDYLTHLYTNAIQPCPGAEHFLVGFPNRFVPDRASASGHPYPGVNDALFMASRDGVHWTRYGEAWVRPGLDDLNWTERNNYPVWGIAETSPTEWSVYISEHYRHPGVPTRLRRLAVRPRGFVSLHADSAEGEAVTRLFTFAGECLRVNFSTSAAGSVLVELCDEAGVPLDGYSAADLQPLFGDALEQTVRWRDGGGLAALARRPVRLRFLMSDADVFALRFGELAG